MSTSEHLVEKSTSTRDPTFAIVKNSAPENEDQVQLTGNQIPDNGLPSTAALPEPSHEITTTLLNAFTSMASGTESASWDVLECGDDKWTYHQLDVISTGLAIELCEVYGPQPTVAFLSENHPYMLALILATWKLGGIIAPYDPHAPEALLEGMMQKVSPACVITPSTNSLGRKTAQALGIPSHAFEIPEVTMPALWKRFANLSADEQLKVSRPAKKDDIAIYIFTSGASSVENLKPVPLSQESLYYGSFSTLSWLKKSYPGQEFHKLRALGWAPWTFLLSFNCDLGGFAFLTGGCYVFSLIPTTYATGSDQTATTVYSGLPDRLLPAIIDKNISTFTTVPLILEGVMAIYKSDEGKRERIRQAFRNMKAYMCGGAKTSPEAIDWAIEIGLPLNLGIGMTELGHPLCCTRVDDKLPGWPIKDCFIHDAELVLVADNGGKNVTEGELHIRSKLISKGYHNHDSSAFSINSDGVITFQTGDVYERIPAASGDRLLWKGRKEDYIQMISGEIIDPRIHQNTLDSCEAIARSCLIGNNFLQATAQHIYAIIQPASGDTSEIFKAIAAINRNLIPSLRIAWSRTLILGEGESIPINRKGLIFRKKLQSLYGDRFAELQSRSLPTDPTSAIEQPCRFTADEVSDIVRNAVCTGLRLPKALVETNAQSTFAELGMDSKMAVTIANSLNRDLGLNLPPNVCHNYIDLAALTRAVLSKLGLSREIPLPPPISDSKPIAPKTIEVVIVGEAIRLPGNLDTPSAFWNALVDRRNDLMTEPPPDRWDHTSFYTSSSDPKPGDITFNKSGFVEIASFDNAFFGISSPEALGISPSARLVLETAFEALEDANIPTSKIKGSDMAVFIATGEDGYSHLLFQEQGFDCYNRYYGTGIANSAICGRLSYLLDIHGPSVSVDTACSGSLVAFDSAVRHLLSGKGESALVCAVSAHTWPGNYAFLSTQRMSSINSRCAVFTSAADGFVPSDGAVALVLKTREAAIRDGDNILGIVKATGVQHDGRSQGLIAPNINSQVSLQRSLLADASLRPSDIDFLEAHGTGTTLGDLIETQAISEVFQKSHSSAKPLVIGAAKSCVGHTENAAGLVGVVKTLLSFQHKLVPGLVHLSEANLNPNIDCSRVPMLIPTSSASLSISEGAPCVALVLANGFAGTVAGTILEAPVSKSPKSLDHDSFRYPMVFALSAKTQSALLEYVENYLDFCKRANASDFLSICYTSCVAREHYKYRFACVVRDLPELVEKLETEVSFLQSSEISVTSPSVVLGFPGQGAQFRGMARSLGHRYPRFLSILSEAASAASIISGFSVLPYLIEAEPPAGPSLDESHIGQVCTFVYQYAIYRWLVVLGVQLQAVIGHSLGEISAAVASGAFSYDLGVKFVLQRSKLLSSDPLHPGAMAAISCTEEVLRQQIETLKLPNSVTIAVYNSRESLVLSGEASSVDAVMTSMKEKGNRAVKLKVDQGFHSPCVDKALPALKAWLSDHDAEITPSKIPFFSSTLGDRAPVTLRLDSAYWIEHAREAVRFDRAANKLVESREFNVVVDVGPQPFVHTALLNTDNHDGQHFLAACTKQGQDQDVAFAKCLASLFELGITTNFALLYDDAGYAKIRLPTYPWQRERHYPSYIPSRNATLLTPNKLLVPQPNGHVKSVVNDNHSSVGDQPGVSSHTAATSKHLELLNTYLTVASNGGAFHTKSHADVEHFIISCLQDVLQFGGDKKLDLSASLVSYGIDSIAFTTIRTRVMKEVGVDVPMVMLSDAFSIRDIIENVSGRVGDVEVTNGV